MNEDISERTNEVIEQNGRMLTSNKQKAKAFLKHYTKISSGKGNILKLEGKRKISEFTLEEFQEATKNLSNEKSPGPDGILTQLFKSCFREKKPSMRSSCQVIDRLY